MKKYIKKIIAGIKRQAKVNPVQMAMVGFLILVLVGQFSLVGQHSGHKARTWTKPWTT